MTGIEEPDCNCEASLSAAEVDRPSCCLVALAGVRTTERKRLPLATRAVAEAERKNPA